MLKFILFGIGFVLVFEGLVYFFFANNIKNFFQIISLYNSEKIRFYGRTIRNIGCNWIGKSKGMDAAISD